MNTTYRGFAVYPESEYLNGSELIRYKVTDVRDEFITLTSACRAIDEIVIGIENALFALEAREEI